MSNFEQQPKKSEELSLETPEQMAQRLGETPQAEPRSVEESFAEVVTAAETQAAIDMQKTDKILEKIQAMPIIDDKTPDTLSMRTVSQGTEQPSSATAEKSLFDRLKFWKRETKTASLEEMTSRAQEDLRKLLGTNEFGKAANFASLDTVKRLGINDSKKWDEVFGPVVREQTLQMIRNGDGKNFSKMLSSDMRLFGTENILPENGQLKPEELRNPEIVQAVKEDFAVWISKFSGNNVKLIDAFVSQRDYWVQKGFVTAEEINELPEVKKKVKNDIIQTAKIMFSKDSMQGNPSGRFDNVKQQWVDRGVFSENEIDSWSEIQKLEA